MSEAIYYKLLLLYYNVVVSVLVEDQYYSSFGHKHRGILQLLHATYILHVQTKQSQTVPFLTAGQMLL